MDKNSHLLSSNNKDLDFYVQKIKNIPVLSKDEEYILTKKFKEKNDRIAIKKIIESNLNYVIKIAKNYTGYGITVKDLIQEGIIGLMKAVKKFDPEKKIRLISFAIYWIKSEIHEYIIKNLRIVKIATTKAQKKLFFNLKKFKKLGWLNENEKNAISNLLNIKNNEIEYMESKLNKKDISIDIRDEENDANIKTIKNSNAVSILKKNDPLLLIEKNNWNTYIKNNLKKAIRKLDKRSQNILRKRWLLKKKYTLRNLSQIYNVSSERIRQLENSAIKKLKTIIKLDI